MGRIVYLCILILLFIANKMQGQNCNDFHTKHAISYASEGYKSTTYSRSYEMTKGELRNIEMEFHKGMDYHLNFAVDDLFASKLFVQILDKQTREVLYDNTEDQFNLDLEFSAVKDLLVNITIETPAPIVKESRYNFSGCVGVLIETRITPPLGFTE